MKRIYQSILLTAIALFSFKCQKEVGYYDANPTNANNQSAPVISTLQGNVLDENGQPAVGVKIYTGSKSAITDSHGYFRIADASLDKNSSLVIAEQPGYFKAYRSFRATTGVNQVVFKLTKKLLAGTLNAATGGEATFANGAKVLLPANGITKAGTAYTGAVQIYAAYIDPTVADAGKTVPGSFMGDDKNNKRVTLSSYGMLAVELESASGEKLQVAPGNEARLTFPIPASVVATAPSTISLWYVDEQTGIWKEQGTAKKTGGSYTGGVKHFSYWNCDIGLPAIAFSAIFKTEDGVPLKNVYVVVKVFHSSTDSSASGIGLAHGYTDSLGQAVGLIPSNMSLTMEVMDDCYNIVYSKNIGPFNQDADLGTIVITNTVSSLLTIKGKLLSCSNTPVSNGYVILSWNDYSSYINTDAEGKFSANIFTCAGVPQEVSVLGVDVAAKKQGSALTIPITAQITDAGNILACGVSSTQFINYTVDGNDYTLSDPVDSLVAFSVPITNAFNTYIQGNRFPDELLHFDFTGVATAGSYTLNTLSLKNFKRVGVVRPFNITVTSFPEHAGEFYEGNFSGKFVDSTSVTVKHAIDCSFRIRKY